ncbi:basic proline-rich protein-like [Sarcophilus harrisii]|uniref:basic proline-rich protein-like n=1 Tax=Sarcophilus harrisii TaxID=9305 RepID=UPI001301FF07|nr:basic proline-rich protein-like [Sarcophilus harrisii]
MDECKDEGRKGRREGRRDEGCRKQGVGEAEPLLQGPQPLPGSPGLRPAASEADSWSPELRSSVPRHPVRLPFPLRCPPPPPSPGRARAALRSPPAPLHPSERRELTWPGRGAQGCWAGRLRERGALMPLRAGGAGDAGSVPERGSGQLRSGEAPSHPCSRCPGRGKARPPPRPAAPRPGPLPRPGRAVGGRLAEPRRSLPPLPQPPPHQERPRAVLPPRGWAPSERAEPPRAGRVIPKPGPERGRPTLRTQGRRGGRRERARAGETELPPRERQR